MKYAVSLAREVPFKNYPDYIPLPNPKSKLNKKSWADELPLSWRGHGLHGFASPIGRHGE